jgi:hypothetical protein
MLLLDIREQSTASIMVLFETIAALASSGTADRFLFRAAFAIEDKEDVAVLVMDRYLANLPEMREALDVQEGTNLFDTSTFAPFPLHWLKHPQKQCPTSCSTHASTSHPEPQQAFVSSLSSGSLLLPQSICSDSGPS